jgi:hypothetical protein
VDLRLLELEREQLVAPDQGHGQHLCGLLLRGLEPVDRRQGDAAEVGEVRGQLLELHQSQLDEVGAEAAAVDGLGAHRFLKLLRGEDLVLEEVLPKSTHGLLGSNRAPAGAPVRMENR